MTKTNVVVPVRAAGLAANGVFTVMKMPGGVFDIQINDGEPWTMSRSEMEIILTTISLALRDE
ncbi:MAG: hypothetical protein ACPGVG_18340 [Mycobacterium sp.]